MNELKPKLVRAASLEASGMKYADIAKELGITPQTMTAWSKKKEYQVLVSKIVDNSLKAAQFKLLEGASDAVSTLLDVMEKGKDSDRLRAAEGVLKMIGIDGVKRLIGPTTMAEKESEDYLLPDISYLKDLMKETDDYLNNLGV